jgi:transcriptional regulator with XRE-family HTH domain
MLNEVFSIHLVTERPPSRGDTPIVRALRMAKANGWNQSRFATKLGVLPQDITNWKNREMPPEWHEPVANLLKCSVDELLGRVPPSKPTHPASRWPFDNIPFKDFDSLDDRYKIEIGEILEDRIRRLNQRVTRPNRDRKSL